MTDELFRRALRALGIEQLVLSIHDVSFPTEADEEIGRGSPYASGARRFFQFVRQLGFDGVQLGPQGQTSLGNLSPYDGSVFSRNTASLPLRALSRPEGAALVSPALVDELVRSAPPGEARAHHDYAVEASSRALTQALHTLRERAAKGEAEARALEASVRQLSSRAPWALHDARFEAFTSLHGTDDYRAWPAGDRAPTEARLAEVEAARRDVVDAWLLGQVLLGREHAQLRARLRALGLRLYGDLQVGISLRDRWAREHLFLPDYAMGAPPSRTNPEGQPWGYPVLDPRQYRTRDERSPVLAFVRARISKVFAEFDGVRVDHPHGLVCPWVYRTEAPDPYEAVRSGARLFETPTPFARAGDHPTLADVAIARADQIDPSVPPYADGWVRGLDDEQVDRYGRLFEIIMEEADGQGTVLCEVLSTCPEPLVQVMRRYGLGRFRVSQKASLVDPRDPYRGENAQPRDWTMIGNHDTEPLLRVMERWAEGGTTEARAAYLATRLEPDASARPRLAAWLASHPAHLATGMCAELFVGPAAHVLVFWADLFGEREVYNTPGHIGSDNWSMRVPRAFERVYAERARAGDALDVASALALALRARRVDGPLRAALEARAVWRPS